MQSHIRISLESCLGQQVKDKPNIHSALFLYVISTDSVGTWRDRNSKLMSQKKDNNKLKWAIELVGAAELSDNSMFFKVNRSVKWTRNVTDNEHEGLKNVLNISQCISDTVE